jgi:uncharacterized protein (TIGR00369 family)
MSNPILQFMQAHVGKSLGMGPSPLAKWLDGILVAADEGTITADFLVRPDMTNPVGILHGGVIAAIMDDLMGATVYALGAETFFTSINLNVDYLFSARVGETVTARSEVIRQGKKVMHVECRLTNADGKLIAKSTSNLVATSTPHT